MVKLKSFILIFLSFSLTPILTSANLENDELYTIVLNNPCDSIEGSDSGSYVPFPGKYFSSGSSQKISMFSSNYLLESYDLPERYDLRTVSTDNGILNYVSKIKNQGSDGLCWAFSSLSSLESHALMNNKSVDYSEAHMAYSLSKYTDVPGVYNPWGFDRTVGDGGNFSMAMAYYSRGSGPVLESNDLYPYPYRLQNRQNSITSSKPIDRYVSDIYVLPNILELINVNGKFIVPDSAEIVSHRNKIKEMIMSYGAVHMGYYMDTKYLNPATSAYYFAPSNNFEPPNHAVSIIGWDDYYEKENFKADSANNITQPPENGAFLIKNSWGKDFGDDGFFWMSYHDIYVGFDAGCMASSKDIIYDNIHQYDPFGYTGRFLSYSGPTAIIANKYKCTPGEKLKAIGFNTIIDNIFYGIYINEHSDDLSQNRLVEYGTLPYSGYHTIEIPETILTGENFAVFLYFQTDTDLKMVVPLEGNNNGYNVTQAVQNEGEGFIKSGSSWFDVATRYNLSLCIKALTDNPPVTDNIDYTVSYLDGNNNLLQTITSGIVKSKIELTNNTENSLNLYIISSLYKNNILYDIKISEILNLTNNTSREIIFDVPADNGYYIKNIVVDKHNLLKPMIKSYSVLDCGGSISNLHYLKNTITLKPNRESSVNLIGTLNSKTLDVTHRYKWESGDNSIATVSPSGRIIGTSEGETYIESNDNSVPKLKVVVTN